MRRNGGRKKICMYSHRGHVLSIVLQEISMMCRMVADMPYIVMQRHYFWGCEYAAVFETLSGKKVSCAFAYPYWFW